MANYGMHSLSRSSSQPGHEASGQGFGVGHWYGSATTHPRCYEPTTFVSCGGHGAGGGYGSCGGPSSYARMNCHNSSGGISAYGGYSGYGGPSGPGGPGGPGGYGNWCSPRSYSSPQWRPSWGN